MHCYLSSFQVALSLVSRSFCTHMSWSVLSWLHEGNTANLQSFFCVKLFLLWCSVLCSLVAMVSLGLPLSLLRSGSPPGSVWYPQLVQCPGNTLKTGNWSNCRAHLCCFLSFRDHCPSLPDVQCFGNYYFLYSIHFFGWFRRVGKSSCGSTLAKSVGSILQSLNLML